VREKYLRLITMLYKLQETRVHLFGTMHLVPVGQEKWKDAVRRAFEAAEVRYMEMHQSKARDLFTGDAISSSLMPADLFSVMAEYWPRTGLPPLETCNLPGVWLVAGNMGVTLTHGVEPHLTEWYGESSMLELETPDELLKAFSTVPLQDWVSALRKRIPNAAGAQRDLEAFYNAWRRQDTQALLRLMRRDLTKAMYEALYTRRNIAWAEKIANEAKSGKHVVFFCGCGHLCGNDSLLEILHRDHGLDATREKQ